MTQTSSTNERGARETEREDNGFVSVGGLAMTVAALDRNERSEELMALGKLIDLRRREQGLSITVLLKQAHVTEDALLDLERGLRMPNTRDVLCLLARVLGLPSDKLLAVAGLTSVLDPNLSTAALRFAAQARPTERLSPGEQSALGEFLHALAVA